MNKRTVKKNTTGYIKDTPDGLVRDLGLVRHIIRLFFLNIISRSLKCYEITLSLFSYLIRKQGINEVVKLEVIELHL
ncbi:MAG: hypothetical protein ACLQT6_12550 [Desulfomonilaceae bacterium]